MATYRAPKLQKDYRDGNVRLSGTGKNRAGQVKIFDSIPKERLKFWKLLSACLSGTGKYSAGQVDLFDKERLNYFVISTPGLLSIYKILKQMTP